MFTSFSFPTKYPPTLAELPLPKLVPASLAAAGSKGIPNPWAEGLFLRLAMPLLAPGESKLLGALMRTAYADMRKDPVFAKCGSAVSYCFASSPHTQGHVLVYSPPNVPRSTPVLLVLNGYGGNLLYLPWAIHQALPEAILVCPSWEIDWMNGPLEDRKEYLKEALAAASAHLGWEINRPWLCGLSQGGIAAFELAESSPSLFRGLIGISTAAPFPDVIGSLKGLPVHLIHGMDDTRISCSKVLTTQSTIEGKGGDARLTILKNAGHFLLLSHPAEFKEFLAKSLGG